MKSFDLTSFFEMIFCSNARFVDKPGSSLLFDTSMEWWPYLPTFEFRPNSRRVKCYAVDYDLTDPQGTRALAFTTPSDYFDKKGFLDAPAPKNIEDYKSPRTNIAFTMDVCTWFLHQCNQGGWPRIDKDRITQTQQPGFKEGAAALPEVRTPVDGLVNTGYALLHEVKFAIHIQPQGSTNRFS